MLIENPIKVDDVISIKLIGAEEILAKLVEETTTAYVVKNPFSIMMQMDGNMVPMPYIFGGDKNQNVPIMKSAVAAIVKTNSELKSHYIKITTGIHTGSSGIITK